MNSDMALRREEKNSQEKKGKYLTGISDGEPAHDRGKGVNPAISHEGQRGGCV